MLVPMRWTMWIALAAAAGTIALLIRLATLPEQLRPVQEPLIAATGLAAFVALAFLFVSASAQ
jgi:hypothetical protein